MEKGSFDLLGNIAIVKFQKGIKASDKKLFAGKLMKENNSVKTVLEKTGKFKGRLRKQTTRYLSGQKNKEAIYHENGCVFRFNVDDTYFSPRLSNERKEIALKIKKGDRILVMFAGVAPFPIIIAKLSKAREVYSNEINRKANEYAKLNIELNKMKGRVILLPGDIKKVAEKLSRRQTPAVFSGRKGNRIQNEIPRYFDVIAMPRPQLSDSFLKEAFSLSKKGTRIYYYDFCKEDEIDLIIDKVKNEAKKNRKKIKILNVKKAGNISPYRYRIRVDFRVL